MVTFTTKMVKGITKEMQEDMSEKIKDQKFRAKWLSFKVANSYNVGEVPVIVYSNGERLNLGPIEYAVYYDIRTNRRVLLNPQQLLNKIKSRIVLPRFPKDLYQKVFVLYVYNRLGNRVKGIIYLVRPEVIELKRKK